MTPEPKMTETQLTAMIRFAKRCEAAYRATGQMKNADQAKAHYEKMEKELKERFGK